jgi:hypothetical protein
MSPRILAAFGSLTLVTGFAPAPFLVKPPSLARGSQLDGRWEIISRDGTPPPGKGKGKGKATKGVTHIDIGQGKWVFQSSLAAGGARSTSYFLKVNDGARPMEFDLLRGEDAANPHGKGVFELFGDELRIAYRFTSGGRPKSVEDDGPPRVVRLTLRRARK